MYGRMSEEEKAPLSSQALVLGLGFYHRSQNDIRGTSQVALMVKNLLANERDVRKAHLIPGSGRSPGERHGNPFQYSGLENPLDRGAWQVTSP